MAKIIITFESYSQLENAASFTYEVDEQYAPDFKAAVAAHPVYGKVDETVMAENGALDANGNPILVSENRPRPSTFSEGLETWANVNVRDVVLGAVNDFRLRRAQALALASVNVEIIKPK